MAEQFLAQAGQTYKNPVTGSTVSFTAEQLQNPAMGWLSSQYVPFTPSAPVAPAAPVAPVQPAPPTPTIPTTVNPAPPSQPATLPSYVIRSGDTLSKIAAKNNTTVNALMAANPTIKNPNLIYAGNKLVIPGAQAPVAPATPTVPPAPPTPDIVVPEKNLNSPSILKEAFTTPKTEADVQKIIENNQKLQLDYINTLKTSPAEATIQADLSALRDKINTYTQGTQTALDTIEAQPIPMGLVTGQQREVQQAAQRTLSNLQGLESNLLQKLGFAQNSRELISTQAKTAIDSYSTNLNLAFALQDKITANKNAVLEQANKMSDSARSSLSMILEKMKGVDPDTLTAEDQAQIANLALKAGLPANLVFAGMRAVKDQQNMDNLSRGLGVSNSQLDEVVASATPAQVAAAIKITESGDPAHPNGNYNAKGGSGEFGAYQFMPGTWQAVSSEYVQATGAGYALPLPQTPANQDAVAEWKVEQLMSRGWSPRQVALIWNTSLSGEEKPLINVGTNSAGIRFNSPGYADKVVGNLAKFPAFQKSTSGVPSVTPSVTSAVGAQGVHYTYEGFPYVPDYEFQQKDTKDKSAADAVVRAAGIPILEKDRAYGIERITAAKKNATDLLAQARKILYSASGDQMSGMDYVNHNIRRVKNMAEASKSFPSADIVAFNSSLANAMSALQGISTLGTGLRPTTDILEKMKNDLPNFGDTVQVAEKKYTEFFRNLNNIQDSIMRVPSSTLAQQAAEPTQFSVFDPVLNKTVNFTTQSALDTYKARTGL